MYQLIPLTLSRLLSPPSRTTHSCYNHHRHPCCLTLSLFSLYHPSPPPSPHPLLLTSQHNLTIKANQIQLLKIGTTLSIQAHQLNWNNSYMEKFKRINSVLWGEQRTKVRGEWRTTNGTKIDKRAVDEWCEMWERKRPVRGGGCSGGRGCLRGRIKGDQREKDGFLPLREKEKQWFVFYFFLFYFWVENE